MIGDQFGPNMHLITGINNRMNLCQNHLPYVQHFRAYADKAYAAVSHTVPAHKALPGMALSMHLHRENVMMSKQRLGVEWIFGRIFINGAFVDCYQRQKIQMSSVAEYFICAAHFSNTFTCCYNANTCWNARAPRLGHYFSYNGYLESDITWLINIHFFIIKQFSCFRFREQFRLQRIMPFWALTKGF